MHSTIMDIIVYRLGGEWGCHALRLASRAFARAINPPKKFVFADSLLDHGLINRHYECCSVAFDCGATHLGKMGRYALKYGYYELLPLVAVHGTDYERSKFLMYAMNEGNVVGFTRVLNALTDTSILDTSDIKTIVMGGITNCDEERMTRILERFEDPANGDVNFYRDIAMSAAARDNLAVTSWALGFRLTPEVRDDVLAVAKKFHDKGRVYTWMMDMARNFYRKTSISSFFG